MLDKQLTGNVIARDVTFEDWIQHYADTHTEWVDGMVIQLSPVSRKHDLLTQFLIHLLRIYLSRTKVGRLMTEPFVMRVRPGSAGRIPDLHIVLNERAGIIQDTMTDGPADVVIEVVSPESEDRDLIVKYHEYQAGGVREYWIVNPLRKQSDFFALAEDGLYRRLELQSGVFRSTILPRFVLDTGVFWQEDALEDDDRIRALVDTMLKGDS